MVAAGSICSVAIGVGDGEVVSLSVGVNGGCVVEEGVRGNVAMSVTEKPSRSVWE